MRYTPVLILLLLALPGRAQHPRSIGNPVLEGVADAGVLKYNGEYYLMGVGTAGDMYVSSDLVHWRGPRHALSMNNSWTPGPAAQDRRIHANDFEYVNGTFHLYWSVNYWGEPERTVHIGHATAEDVMGPYQEPVTDTWFDSRIDPHLFIDDDGTPYFYSVKFADGNVIYGQKMSDPWTLIGEPRFLLSAHPDTWEARAHRINEGPEVDLYRGRYYMLYASNHVGARWGQYAIGVAEAGHPLGFNNATKYDHPVIGPTNEERLMDAATVLVPIAEGGWRYAVARPQGKAWTKASYDDSGWEEGSGAFGSHVVENSTTNRTHTRWKSPGLWMRKTFQLEKQPSEHVQLLMRLHGTADVYLNGKRILRSDGMQNYATIDLGNASAFRRGENVLAVHARRSSAERQYVDVGLLDPETHPGEAYIFSPGQPNLVRGPNGFEWWLVYFGRFDGGGKSQAIDRVYFFDQKLHVDGPTGPRTPGYHPPPRPPTFRDLFSEAERSVPGAPWQATGGRWRVRSGEVLQSSQTGTARVVLSEPAGTHYLFQAGVRVGEGREAGIVAFQNEAGDRLVVGLNPKKNVWTYRLKQDGAQTEHSFPLPEEFAFEAYHTLRVAKNGSTFHISIDGRPARGRPVLETALTGKGWPGLYTRAARAAFDGITYTRGWDEYDGLVRGWQPLPDDEAAWHTDADGLHQTAPSGTHRVVKGDPLAAYEFSVQVYGKPHAARGEESVRRAGFIPVYVDENNWLRAEVDMDTHQLVVEHVKNGERAKRQTIALAARKQLYPDATHSDNFAKRYTLRSPTLIDDLRVMQEDARGARAIPASWEAAYCQDGRWKSLPRKASAGPVLAEALRVEVGDEGHDVGTLTAQVAGKSTYHLRAVKLPGEVILFVDGQEVHRVRGHWPASRVGLSTQGTKARFDGLLRFDIPVQGERTAP